MTDRSKETFRSSVEFHVLNKQEAQKVRVAQHCKGVVTRAMESPSVRQFFILAKLLNSPQHNPSMHSLKSPFTDPSTKSVCISGGLIHTNCSYEQPGGACALGKAGQGLLYSRCSKNWELILAGANDDLNVVCLTGRGWEKVTFVPNEHLVKAFMRNKAPPYPDLATWGGERDWPHWPASPVLYTVSLANLSA